MASWLVCDRLSYHYAEKAAPWYLPTALSFYLLYTFGLRFAPAVVLVNVIRGIFSLRHFLTIGWLFGLGGITALTLIPTIWLIRRLKIRLFAGFNDAIAYLVVGCVVFPFVRSLLGVAILCASGSSYWPDYWRDFYSFFIGDLVGMATLVPFLIVFLTPRIAPSDAVEEERSDHPMPWYESAGVLLVLAAGLALGYDFVRSRDNAVVYFFVFLPLTWLVVRGGLRWAVFGMLVSDVLIVALQKWFAIPASASAAYQSYIATSSFTVLTLGAAVNQRRREQREAVERARSDAVTGLPSRQAFEDWLSSDAALPAAGISLVLIEVETIRLADEWLDPQGVDALQAGVAEVLRTHAAGALMLAHVSSNVFALVLAGDDRANAEITAKNILASFETPINVVETELYVYPAIGVAVGASEVTPLELLHWATQAVRVARERGRAEIAFYAPEREQEAVLSLVAQLHRAYRDGEFMLYYQPIWSCSYNTDTHESEIDGLTGAEALLRWNHPERGILSPDAFLDLLGSMPLSERVGAWIIDNACLELSIMRQTFPDCSMWINLFDRQAYARDLADSLKKTIRRYILPPESIVIELNERTIADDESDLDALVESLHRVGVRVAVDDFGTGHSSYARLREASVDILKIDRSFIPVGEPKGKMSDVLLGLLNFAKDLGVIALAEGVENDQQFAWLTRNGCSIIQGFALGAPLPPHAFTELARTALKRRHGAPR